MIDQMNIQSPKEYERFILTKGVIIMHAILHEIEMNISRKKLELISKELHNMRKQTDIMENTLNSINKVHDQILYKKNPKGSSFNAIKYLKLQL